MVKFQVERINGEIIPIQNNIVVPSFEPQERKIISLNGTWKKLRFNSDSDFSMDNRDEKWLNTLENENGMYIKSNFDDSVWKEHTIPLAENLLSGEEKAKSAESYEDGVWYRRKFLVEDDIKDKSIILKCLAINYVADIWINGKYVGNHEGGFTPFAFDVTKYINFNEENTIAIRVDNPAWGSRNDIIPAMSGTDFFNYTGILQDIYLEITSDVNIPRVDVVPVDINGTVNIKVFVQNTSSEKRSVKLKADIFEGNTSSEQCLLSPIAASIKDKKAKLNKYIKENITLEANEVKILNYSVKIEEVKLWGLGMPNLYVLEATITTEDKIKDRFSTQFGVRTLKTKGQNILLNEKSIFLSGIARHEEWPSTGRTASWNRIINDLKQIKELKANMVRTAHYPNHVCTYIALDRLGLAAMSEIPLWQFEDENFIAQEKRLTHLQMWREMIFSQYNRPSVFMWSTQNESNAVELRKSYNEMLVNDIRNNYNDGRLITQSAAADRPGYFDPSMEPLDVVAWTMYFGIFHGSTPYEGTKDFLEKAKKYWPNKPLLNTEYGIWSGQGDVLSDEQIKITEDTLKALLEYANILPDGSENLNGGLAGIDYWIMYNWYVNHNEWVQTMGLYHMDRKSKKPIAKIIKSYYEKYTKVNNGILK